MKTVLERFKDKYGYLQKYRMVIDSLYLITTIIEEISGETFIEAKNASSIYELIEGEKYEITIFRPFIFDNRLIPEEFEGVKIKNVEVGERPQEFDVDEKDESIPLELYDAPEKYIAFVDRCFDEIRLKLDNPKMTKEEMLDALTFEGNFAKHIEKVEKWRIER